MTPRHIAVLFHENTSRSDLLCSAVFHLAALWTKAGHRVTFLFGTRRFVPADLLIVHVDLSVVPDQYLRFASLYPAAVNHRVKDIRKSVTSGILVREGSDWRGPVIVKSDLNYGGEPEFRLGTWPILRRSRAGRFLLRRSPRRRRLSPLAGWHDYPIFARFEDVPRGLARDPRLVVERFIPEIQDGLHHLRVYLFLGDYGLWQRIAARGPLVKAANTVATEIIGPDSVVEGWRRSLGLEFGKLDYVVHEGVPVLLDANKTVGIDPHPGRARDERRQAFAAGIDSLLRAAP